MRALLRCDIDAWDPETLCWSIGGLALLTRHLLALRNAGITHVDVVVPRDEAKFPSDSLVRLAPAGVSVSFVSGEEARQRLSSDEPVIEQRADTLVDPRLLSQLIRGHSDGSRRVICLDSWVSNYAPAVKSPYRVGAPGPDEAQPQEVEGQHPIGIAIAVNHNAPTRALHVGRYYWHRIAVPSDVAEATKKVFLSTMKPTDGFYARTNRWVSIPISKLLVRTPITPNLVTLIGLGCSVAGAGLYSAGTYWFMLAGSLVSWFASMLDGVDGEIARTKFKASEFGAWFEMVCDYLYYAVTFLGMGIGVARYTGNPFWYWAGIGSVFGTVLSFFVIARLRKRYARQASSSDFGRAFQKKVGEGASRNPIHFLSRQLGFLITRAAMPYFIVLFTLFGIAPWILGMILVGTNMAWSLTLAAYPLFRARNSPQKSERSTQ